MLLQVSRIKIQQGSTYSQTLRYGQYLKNAHSHITPTVAVTMWSCPCLHGSHRRGAMAVHMPKIMTTPRSLVAYASLLNLGLTIDCMC